jgi:hypothetical protein
MSIKIQLLMIVNDALKVTPYLQQYEQNFLFGLPSKISSF